MAIAGSIGRRTGGGIAGARGAGVCIAQALVKTSKFARQQSETFLLANVPDRP